MKILLAEDEQDLQEVIAAYLEYQGHHVTLVSNGAQAVEKAAADAYDAIIMDIMMPVMDGIEALKRIRRSGNTIPAIFLTAKAEVSDRVEGLDAGADDYLTKPFALEELGARLRALHRRKRDYKVRILRFANLELDTEASELRAGNTIALALKEVRLLSCLLSNADRKMTTQELMDEIWPGENPSPQTVWMYVSFLNAKLRSIRANAVIDGDMSLPYHIRETKE